MNDDELRERFEDALRRGEDPINAQGTSDKITTVDSRWATRKCAWCRHNFRLDDPVRTTYDEHGKLVEVWHLDPLLQCGAGQDAADGPAGERALVDRLYAAADLADPPPETPHLTRLHPGHELLQRREKRSQCPKCVNTLRPFEVVVICPCGLDCARAVHQDDNHGLTCYARMFAQHKAVICLMTKTLRDPR